MELCVEALSHVLLQKLLEKAARGSVVSRETLCCLLRFCLSYLIGQFGQMCVDNWDFFTRFEFLFGISKPLQLLRCALQ